ncbi:hypothetical protein WSK_3051 [Novosphingobium sp. Rr 2-17]|nr:hypothetical protein WSK_3051 [Novosphingobium sp. Rr 2-17]
MSMGHAREKIAAWTDDYNTERSYSSLGYATPAALAAQAIAQPALMRDNEGKTLIAT